MTLNEYLCWKGALSVRELRLRMMDYGSPVKSNAQIRQWQHRYADRLPCPLNCVAIEYATRGMVTREELRPHDWALIWPELKPDGAARAARWRRPWSSTSHPPHPPHPTLPADRPIPPFRPVRFFLIDSE